MTFERIGTEEMTFDRFENTYEIQGTIKMETPLRIGKQIAPYSVSSAPVLLQYDAAKRDYMPFIPGSSLKGVLRSSCERIVKSYGEQVCNLPVTCGTCRICNVFGAQEVGAKIRVRDCKLSTGVNLRYTEERPHYADRGGLRYEEDIPPFCFDLHIDIANATEKDIALVLLGLDEFNHKRAHLGGGVSRGLGFASVEIKRIIEKRVDDFRVNKKDKKDIKPLNLSLRPGFKGGMDFSCYWRADDNTLNGCIVCELEAECQSNFHMKGADEENITMNGTPIIPGSVIKGFLRKHFIAIRDRKWDADKIDDVFGSTRREGHRSRVLVSDAFPSDKFIGDKLLKGTKLTCWLVFDNMAGEEIKEILKVFKKEEPISGDTSAKGYNKDGEKLYNHVTFRVTKARKFTLEDPAFDVMEALKNE
jgi:CRISPR/Cas system CSM-associated protein Csm3 (group 7 of RAMP superfamily)